MLKKAIATIIATSMLFSGCGCATTITETTAPVEHTNYMVRGRYYTSGELITQDGNTWGYDQAIISEQPSYDNEPVFAIFDDNGTPDNIYDDEILGLVRDVETAIYDELEVALSESFTLERDGNNIKIITD